MARRPPRSRSRRPASRTVTPTRHGRGVRLGATIIIAALVLALVGGLLATLPTDRADDAAVTGEPTPTPTPPLPRLVPTLVPDGLTIQAVTDLASTPTPAGGPTTTYFFFGAGPPQDPFAEGDVVLGVTVGLGPDLGFDPSDGELTVGSDPALSFVDPTTGASGISWSPAPGEAWSMLSRSLDPPELADLASELAAAEGLPSLAGGELELVAISDDLLGALSGPGDGVAASAGHNLVYGPPAGGGATAGSDGPDEVASGRSISFWALPANPSGLVPSRWILGPSASDVVLPDGTPALAGTITVSHERDATATVSEATPYTTLEWALGPVALSIAAVGVDLDELLELAASTTALGEAEWAALAEVMNAG